MLSAQYSAPNAQCSILKTRVIEQIGENALLCKSARMTIRVFTAYSTTSIQRLIVDRYNAPQRMNHFTQRYVTRTHAENNTYETS